MTQKSQALLYKSGKNAKMQNRNRAKKHTATKPALQSLARVRAASLPAALITAKCVPLLKTVRIIQNSLTPTLLLPY